MDLSLTRNTYYNVKLAFVMTIFLLATLTEAKVLNCRPLPECCRKYVFSPACRGAYAKRNDYSVFKGNDDFLRDPRTFSGDVDYVSNSAHRNPPSNLSDEDIKRLNHLPKNPAEFNAEYLY